MKYWWVNQNQTFDQETKGGYMWSPKTKKDGSRNVFYDNMREVSPGDIVFSFYKKRIPCIGIIESQGYSQNKPEFGKSGAAWGIDGWMVNVEFKNIQNAISPKEHIEVIAPLLPEKYSPLRKDGNGLQSVYLASLPDELGKKLASLIGGEVDSIFADAREFRGASFSDTEAAENQIEKSIKRDKRLPETESQALIKARKGQGLFRKVVLEAHKACPFTGITNPKLLKASHIKPWAKCESHIERLDPLNGLPLSPTADHLFDKGFISFNEHGEAIFSGALITEEFEALGFDLAVGKYTLQSPKEATLNYLEYHRKFVFMSV